MDVEQPRAIAQAQLADEAIMARSEPPFASRDDAGEVPARRIEVACKQSGGLFAPSDQLACVDRKAVMAAFPRDVVDDVLVVAAGGARDADRPAAPGADRIRRWRGRELRCRVARDKYGDTEGKKSQSHVIRCSRLRSEQQRVGIDGLTLPPGDTRLPP